MTDMSLFGNRRIEAKTWPQLLAAASTPEEVAAAVRDFLAEWSPDDLAVLPRECQPPAKFRTPDEIVVYAFNLAQARCDDEHENPALLRMARFFSEAARQVATVMNPTHHAHPASPNRSPAVVPEA